MKRILTTLLVLARRSSAVCLADGADLSGYTDAELYELLEDVTRELKNRARALIHSPASDFVYASNGSEVRINDYIGTDANVVIPDEIDGVPVTRIYEFAFHGKTLYSLSMPESISEVGRGAFFYALTNVDADTALVLPKAVAKIGTQAFSGSGYGGVVISSDAYIDVQAFQGMNNLAFLYIREGASPQFENAAFVSCGSLETAVIPASVVKIHSGTFQGCKKLTVVTPEGSPAHKWATENFFPVDTEHYEEYAALYEALYPAD